MLRDWNNVNSKFGECEWRDFFSLKRKPCPEAISKDLIGHVNDSANCLHNSKNVF